MSLQSGSSVTHSCVHCAWREPLQTLCSWWVKRATSSTTFGEQMFGSLLLRVSVPVASLLLHHLQIPSQLHRPSLPVFRNHWRKKQKILLLCHAQQLRSLWPPQSKLGDLCVSTLEALLAGFPEQKGCVLCDETAGWPGRKGRDFWTQTQDWGSTSSSIARQLGGNDHGTGLSSSNVHDRNNNTHFLNTLGEWKFRNPTIIQQPTISWVSALDQPLCKQMEMLKWMKPSLFSTCTESSGKRHLLTTAYYRVRWLDHGRTVSGRWEREKSAYRSWSKDIRMCYIKKKNTHNIFLGWVERKQLMYSVKQQWCYRKILEFHLVCLQLINLFNTVTEFLGV